MNQNKIYGIFILLLALLGFLYFYLQELLIDPIENAVLPQTITIKECNFNLNQNITQEEYSDCLKQNHELISKHEQMALKSEDKTIKNESHAEISDFLVIINGKKEKKDFKKNDNSYRINIGYSLDYCVGYGTLGQIIRPDHSIEIITNSNNFITLCLKEGTKEIIEITSKSQKIENYEKIRDEFVIQLKNEKKSI